MIPVRQFKDCSKGLRNDDKRRSNVSIISGIGGQNGIRLRKLGESLSVTPFIL